MHAPIWLLRYSPVLLLIFLFLKFVYKEFYIFFYLLDLYRFFYNILNIHGKNNQKKDFVIYANLTNSVQGPSKIELNMIIIKLEIF